MNLDHYDLYTGSDNFYYEFYSEGPKGRIRKIIQFHMLQTAPDVIYNLGFGDWIPEADEVDDLVVSNNKDRKKVLATVARAVIDFTENRRDAFIVVEGSTASRTRLYQMGIAEFHDDISAMFHISGMINDQWHMFKKGKKNIPLLQYSFRRQANIFRNPCGVSPFNRLKTRMK